MKKLFLSLTNLILLFVFFLFLLAERTLNGWSAETISIFYTIVFILFSYLANFYFHYKKSLIFKQQLFVWSALYILLTVFMYYIVFKQSSPFISMLNDFAIFIISQIVFSYLINNLDQYKNALEVILIDEEDMEFNKMDMDKILESELYRSRRYDHKFNIHILNFDVIENNQKEEVLKDMMKKILNRFISFKTYEILRANLRRSDIICNIDKNNKNQKFLLLCPESDQDHISIVERKLSELAKEMNVNLSIGSASFPLEAVTNQELLKIANDRAEKNNNKNE